MQFASHWFFQVQLFKGSVLKWFEVILYAVTVLKGYKKNAIMEVYIVM